MAKKIVKKRKLKIVNLLLVLLILIGLFFGVYFLLKIPVQNIIVTGTSYLNDDYILELGGIKEYPSFLQTRSSSVEKKIERSNYVYKVTLKKKFGFLFVVEVEENRPLFFDTSKSKFVFDSSEEVEDEEISHSFRVPRLLNYVPDNKYKNFIKGMKNIKEDTLSKIADIEYKPNDFDKDRFLLYMDDGNMVYLTLTKFRMINHYNEVLSQLEHHKGILYLDSGNHFQIKE